MYEKIISVVVLICVLFSMTINVYSVAFLSSNETLSRNSIYQYLNDMSKIDSEYLMCSDGISLEYVADLYLPNGNDTYAYLYSIYKTDYIGYVIVRSSDYVVIESALSDNPYSLMNMNYRSAEKLIYDHYDYGIQLSDRSVVMMSESEVSVCEGFNDTSVNDNDVSLYNVGTVPIYSQGTFNCIACAVGHLLLYWDTRCPGFTRSVSSQADFERLLNTVYFYYQDYDQDGIKFDNDDTPRAIAEYADFRSNNTAYGTVGIVYAVRASNYDYPAFSQLLSIINGGSPVLLGYKAGSVYSQIEGHMTMCVDAYTSGGVNYVKVVDGHVLSQVTRAWSNQYNDYMMTLNVSMLETQ